VFSDWVRIFLVRDDKSKKLATENDLTLFFLSFHQLKSSIVKYKKDKKISAIFWKKGKYYSATERQGSFSGTINQKIE